MSRHCKQMADADSISAIAIFMCNVWPYGFTTDKILIGDASAVRSGKHMHSTHHARHV